MPGNAALSGRSTAVAADQITYFSGQSRSTADGGMAVSGPSHVLPSNSRLTRGASGCVQIAVPASWATPRTQADSPASGKKVENGSPIRPCATRIRGDSTWISDTFLPAIGVDDQDRCILVQDVQGRQRLIPGLVGAGGDDEARRQLTPDRHRLERRRRADTRNAGIADLQDRVGGPGVGRRALRGAAHARLGLHRAVGHDRCNGRLPVGRKPGPARAQRQESRDREADDDRPQNQGFHVVLLLFPDGVAPPVRRTPLPRSGIVGPIGPGMKPGERNQGNGMPENVNRQWQLAARPQGEPKDSDFRLAERPVPAPGAGQLLVRTIYLSLDPYMRAG